MFCTSVRFSGKLSKRTIAKKLASHRQVLTNGYATYAFRAGVPPRKFSGDVKLHLLPLKPRRGTANAFPA